VSIQRHAAGGENPREKQLDPAIPGCSCFELGNGQKLRKNAEMRAFSGQQAAYGWTQSSEGARMCRVSLQPESSVHFIRGFTLLELVIGVTILAILGGLAAPSFTGMWLDAQRTTAVNGFIHSVFLARSVAVTSGRTVTICRSTDTQTCSHQVADWQAGWVVFVNTDDDQPPTIDANERVLEVFQARPGGIITSNRPSYSFRPHVHRVVNGSMVFCDRRGSAQARAVIINSAGRPRVSSRDSNGRPLRCPSG
jgi:type IV fimbrial biogenesis protein FimT